MYEVLFALLWQATGQKQSKKGRVNFAPQPQEATIHEVGKARKQECGRMLTVATEPRLMNTGCSAHFLLSPFYSVQTPAHRTVPPPSGCVLPPQLNLSGISYRLLRYVF